MISAVKFWIARGIGEFLGSLLLLIIIMIVFVAFGLLKVCYDDIKLAYRKRKNEQKTDN